MAAIFTIIGGILGFASALATLVIAQAGFLVALAVWSGIGVSFLILGLLVALMPRAAQDEAKTVQKTVSA